MTTATASAHPPPLRAASRQSERSDTPVPPVFTGVHGMTCFFPLSPIAADQLPPSTDGVVRHFAVTKVEWNFDAFEPLIRELADEDDGRSLLVTNFDTGDVYAPYPGGADLFFHRFREHDEAVHRFGDWRSKRSDGL